METTIAQKEWTKEINGKEWGKKKVSLRVVGKVYKLREQDIPYFSITGEINLNDKRYRDPIVACGCIHETILEHFPQLAPLVEMHLSEIDGHPMHAEANARYWAGVCTYPDGSPMGEYKRLMLAKHLHTDPETADAVRDGFLKGLPWFQIVHTLKLVELWNTKAGKARSFLSDVSTPEKAVN
jgi:hypothetical protein